MKIVTEVSTQQEFDDMKSVMEIFVITNRIRQIFDDA
jgi:hypothetical protein